MAQRDPSTPIKAPAHDEPAPGEAGTVSIRGAVAVGGLLLAWASLVPLAWLSVLLVNEGLAALAILLCGTGVPVFVWSSAQLRRRLFSLFQNNVPRKLERGTVGIAPLGGIQACSAILCTHFAAPVITPGLQHWFWVPISAFGGLLLTSRIQMAALLAALLLVSTLCYFWTDGADGIWHWMAGQTAISGFTMGCCAAVAWMSRLRQATSHAAADVMAANARLELQADHAAYGAVARERQRLAEEIQESVGHSLNLVDTHLERAQNMLSTRPCEALKAVQKARWATHDGQAEIRRSVLSSYVAPARKKKSLTECLTTLVGISEHAGLTLSIRQRGVYRALPALVEISLYRCAQEGINHARRHARATEIDVTLDFSSKSVVSLYVRDNGHDFRHFSEEDTGLKRLEERALLLHGKFKAGTTPNGEAFCQMALPG